MELKYKFSKNILQMHDGLKETFEPLGPLATCLQLVCKELVNACRSTYLCVSRSLCEHFRRYPGLLHCMCLVSLKRVIWRTPQPTLT